MSVNTDAKRIWVNVISYLDIYFQSWNEKPMMKIKIEYSIQWTKHFQSGHVKNYSDKVWFFWELIHFNYLFNYITIWRPLRVFCCYSTRLLILCFKLSSRREDRFSKSKTAHFSSVLKSCQAGKSNFFFFKLIYDWSIFWSQIYLNGMKSIWTSLMFRPGKTSYKKKKKNWLSKKWSTNAIKIPITF